MVRPGPGFRLLRMAAGAGLSAHKRRGGLALVLRKGRAQKQPAENSRRQKMSHARLEERWSGVPAKCRLLHRSRGKRYAASPRARLPAAVAAELKRALDSIRAAASPVKRLRIKGAVWVEPRLRAEVDYRGRTADGRLRHASFKGIVE